ncbi:hypothetical protein [Plantactinospora sp. KBS50]|uniref:hypothetical protein n=1 Tax=Plantactinospora sp. KBS50 TaxID=2024580 RepID=UPI0012FD75C2|nr:hypothetical protein [Plantactinospora sp. KBS50]
MTGGAAARDGSRSPQQAAAIVAATADRATRIAAVVIAFGWHLAINLPAVLGSWSVYRWPWAEGAGWLVFAAVGLVAAYALLADVPVPAWPLLALLLGADAVSFAFVPGDLLFHAANWGWGTLGWFVALVLWRHRIAALIGVLAAGAGIALVALLAAGATRAADLSRFGMYVYGTVTLPIILVVGAHALRRLATGTAGTAAAQTALDAEQSAAVLTRRERQERLALVSRTAGTVLAELADGRADPADPAVRRRCALAAGRLRRLIAEADDAPDPLLHELRACADLTERRGLAVEFVVVGELPALPVQARRQLADPLVAALATARDWARLTVVGGPDEVVVSVTTGPSADPDPAADTSGSDGHGVEWFSEHDEEMVWTQTRWRAT